MLSWISIHMYSLIYACHWLQMYKKVKKSLKKVTIVKGRAFFLIHRKRSKCTHQMLLKCHQQKLNIMAL